MKVCVHVIKNDTGLAPNPFHNYCTSALCTPSHMNAKLNKGDWLIGNSPKADGNRLVYAMRISEVLPMDKYFHDPRFANKKPKPSGTPEEQCGDNIYFRDRAGQWKRLRSRYHNDERAFSQDVGKNVFVSDYFYYFGNERVIIPDHSKSIIQTRQGFHYEEGQSAKNLIVWLEGNYKPGRLGMPRDMTDQPEKADTMIAASRADSTEKTEVKQYQDNGLKSRSPAGAQGRPRGCG